MANRPVHDIGGIVMGAGFAYWQAQGQTAANAAAETVGGAFAGFLASRLPDIFDPPTSPNHRHIAHGALTATVAVGASWQAALRWQQQLRRRADELAVERMWVGDDFYRLSNALQEIALRVLAGAIVGVVGGYGSHLALDAMTGRGLPLITCEF